MAQPVAQLLRRQLRVPRPDRLALVVEHADQLVGQVAQRGLRRVDRGPRDLSCRRDRKAAEVGVLAGPALGLGDVQLEAGLLLAVLGHGRSLFDWAQAAAVVLTGSRVELTGWLIEIDDITSCTPAIFDSLCQTNCS